MVTSAFDAPTAKWASVLMMKDAITAGIPTVKKNGTIGMNPPTAVDREADPLAESSWIRGREERGRPLAACIVGDR